MSYTYHKKCQQLNDSHEKMLEEVVENYTVFIKQTINNFFQYKNFFVNEQDIEDIYLAVLLSIYNYIKKKSPIFLSPNWIKQRTIWISMNEYKKLIQTRTYVVIDDTLLSLFIDTNDYTQDMLLNQDFEKCKSRLNDKEKIALSLENEHGMCRHDIANILQVSLEYVHKIMSRAKESLYKCLKCKGYSIK
ncbi:hypothetical protein MHK_006198 [Candidatus Magnetomorum sp. HK-1]|nr:hypothetical protein MHK_006198 [Candidatus Magnetomorum sp. HK-1]